MTTQKAIIRLIFHFYQFILDSFWNESKNETLFDDNRTAVSPYVLIDIHILILFNYFEVAARQALDDLFETRVQLNTDVLSVSDSDHLTSENDNSNNPTTSNEFARPSTNNISELRDTYQADNKLNSVPSEKPRRLGSVSVLSDCSVSSFVTESTSNIDYGRIKSELRQLQRDYKVFLTCKTGYLIQIKFSVHKKIASNRYQ